MTVTDPAGAEPGADVLRDGGAGTRVVRGTAARLVAYGVGVLFTALASILLLRHLGLVDFGRYALVMAIVAIVQGISDAGLTIIGARELARLPPGAQRSAVLSQLLALRLVFAPVAVALAVLAAWAAGYPPVIVSGIALAGAGMVLLAAQGTLMQPLSVEMRNLRLALADVYRQGIILVLIAALVAAGMTLTAFFAAHIAVGLAMLAATPLLVGGGWRVRPRATRADWKRLLSASIPLAVSYALSLLYFRVVLIELSAVSDDVQVGLFGTSLRVFELLLGLPTLVLGVALPVLSAAAADGARLRYQLQRLTEAALLVATLVALLVAVSAEAVILILGGEEFRAAAGVLSLHVVAFVPVFVTNVFQTALVATGHQSLLVPVNAAGLALLLPLAYLGIELGDARGAAVSVIVAECVLAGLTYAALRRREPTATPHFGFAWRLALAIAAGAAAGFLTGLAPLPATVLAGLAFSLVAVAVRVVPPEILEGLRHGRRRKIVR